MAALNPGLFDVATLNEVPILTVSIGQCMPDVCISCGACERTGFPCASVSEKGDVTIAHPAGPTGYADTSMQMHGACLADMMPGYGVNRAEPRA